MKLSCILESDLSYVLSDLLIRLYIVRGAKLGKIQGGVGEVTQNSGPFLKGSTF